MSNKRILDMSELMRGRQAATAPALPGVHGRRTNLQAVQTPEEPKEEVTSAPEKVEESTPEPVSPEKQPLEAVKDEQPEEAVEQVEQPEPEKKPEPKKRKPATQRKTTTSRKPAATKKPAAPAEPASTDELVSLDGRPARLWDISGGQELPAGWARIALERVHKSARHFRADRRNTTLPDNIYTACNEFIYQEARDGGLALTLSNLAEAAYEQIPIDDPAGIQRLLDGLPDSYFDKGLQTRPRTFQLFEPTLQHMQNLAPMLRALGFTGKTGLVQTAALRELLLDLGVNVND